MLTYSTFKILTMEFPLRSLPPSPTPRDFLSYQTLYAPPCSQSFFSWFHRSLSLHNNALNFHTYSAYQCQTLQKLIIQILSPQLLLEKGQNVLPIQTTELPGALLQLSHPFTVSIWMLTKFPRAIIPNLLSHSLSLESHLLSFFFSFLNLKWPSLFTKM